MNKFLRKNLQMQLIVACCFLGTTFSASLLRIDFPGAKEVLKTEIEEMNKTKDPPKINKLIQHYNQTYDSRRPSKNHPSDSEKEPGLLNPNKTDQNAGVLELVTDSPTVDCSETGTDYATETSEYETTTICGSLNRFGGVPPNVMASLLG